MEALLCKILSNEGVGKSGLSPHYLSWPFSELLLASAPYYPTTKPWGKAHMHTAASGGRLQLLVSWMEEPELWALVTSHKVKVKLTLCLTN
jgi:hypothetical protein